MSRRKRAKEPYEPSNCDGEPSWVTDDPRTTPYTEEELDLLVEGTLESIRDTAVWKSLVHQVGMKEALERLRAGLIMRDENIMKLLTH